MRPSPLYPNTPRTINVLRDGRLLLAREDPFDLDAPEAFRERTATVMLYATDGSLLDTVARLPNGQWGQSIPGPQRMWVPPWFEPSAAMAAREERIVLGHTSESELRVHTAAPGFPVERIIRWAAGDRTVRSEDVAAEKARLEARYVQRSAERRAMLLDPLISDRRPVAERFPAFGRLRLGRDGHLWVREYPRPRGPTEHRWIGFAADGRFVCRLVTPPFDEVIEFGADYVLTFERDSLGVERVRQYPLTR